MRLLDRRVRGFRLVDLVGLGVLVVIILGVYLAKTLAGRERAETARIERQIHQEKARIRLLRAEVAHLEQPSRIVALSETFLGLQPASMKRELTADELAAVLASAKPAVVVLPAAGPAPAVPVSAPLAPAPAAPAVVAMAAPTAAKVAR